MTHIATAVALLAVSVAPAAAQHVCASRTDIVKSLEKEYQEAPSAMGMSDNGAVIEVLSARDGKTWTILMTTPDGNSCVVATGEMWEPLPQQVAKAGNGA
jgi:hypothetical protein